MVPPVPIPNTVVKHSEAESTWVETPWEDRKLPVNREHLPLYGRCFFRRKGRIHPSFDFMRVPSEIDGGR